MKNITNLEHGEQKLREIAESVKMAMLVTEVNGNLHGRPMSTADVDAEGNLWFFTNEYSEKVREIANDHRVFLTYASRSDNSYMTVNGTASVVTDRAKMKELWTPIIKAWFPDGLDDPKLALLKIHPTDAEYWDGSSNKAVVLFRMVQSALSGGHYEDGEHGTVKL